MFLYQVINNTNETVINSHVMMKAVNHAYISIVHDNFKNITVWKDENSVFNGRKNPLSGF